MPSRQDSTEAWNRRCGAAALAAALACALALGGANPVESTPVFLFLFAAAAVVAWAVALGRAKLFRSSAWIPMLGFGLLVAVQGWAGASIAPGATREGWISLLACAVMFYLALSGSKSATVLRRNAFCLTAFLGVVAAVALAQFYFASGRVYGLVNASYGTPMGPYIYHNHFAGMVELLLPLGLAAMLEVKSSHPVRKCLAGLACALALAAIVVSQSRGGLFVLAGQLLVGMWLLWPRLRRSRSLQRRALATAAFLGIFLAAASWGPMLRRLRLLGYGDQSTAARIEVAQACLRIWRDHPWIGTGFGTFASIYPRYERTDTGKVWESAHNDYAQLLAETGAVGAFLAAWVLLCILVAGRRLRRARPSPQHALQLGCWLGLAGLLMHAAGDFEFHSPANALLFFLLAGCVLGTRGAGAGAVAAAPGSPRTHAASSLAFGAQGRQWGLRCGP